MSQNNKLTPFVHLHVHSQYSVLDGQAAIEDLVDKAMADGMPGIALTDHGAMFGIKTFYNYVKKKNNSTKAKLGKLQEEIEQLSEKENTTAKDQTKLASLKEEVEKLQKDLDKPPFIPILGCECYCARRGRKLQDKTVLDERGKITDRSGWHLILLAKNKTGYKNLIKMVSLSWTEGFYGKPRIDKELLEKYHEGIICTSACLGGEIPQHILAGRLDEAEESAAWFKSIFGDDYYIEIQRHKTDHPQGNKETYKYQQLANEHLLQIAKKLDIKVVATNDVHFTNKADAEAHDHLICLSTGRNIDDPSRLLYTKQEWLKTTAEMNEIFADIPEVLSNTMEIFNKVEQYSIDSKPLMPVFPLPEGFESDDDYLKHLTYEGAKKKYKEAFDTEEVRERIDFELDTMKKMGFPGYFLIVQDFINQAKNMGISVGPGRGSAAGSAVAYCLGITDIDPIKYDLLFERFLNPDRISMPDIDVDFDDDGRGEILRWVTEKYGEARVAHIVTYGTMAAKSAIKDVARVEELSLNESINLTKMIPAKIPEVKNVTLKEVAKHVPDFQKALLSPNPKIARTIKYATELEGNVRNIGVHACGIIIGKTDIDEVVPVCVQKGKDDEQLLVTQYEGSVIEETGLIKMDFLGLKTLSIIKEAVANIKRTQGIELDINTIPIDDPATYRLYCEGRTIGTFQFESPGMQKHLRSLQPSAFEDLIAMNALYRPGPMDYIPQFIRRKHGAEAITYDLPEMKRYLKETYGITVYQEQVMLLSRQLANFTRGESDTLRKAMGKKLVDKMAELKVKFITNGQKNGHPLKILEKIWEDWAAFAKYAFNKSHATCYSWVAYQTAYLKANYPSEYMAGALSRNLNNKDELIKLMEECKSMGISVLVPDINESEFKFSVNKKGDIRFGMNAIAGIPSGAVRAIIEERQENGPYTDIYDLVTRVKPSDLGKKALESLVLSGAFDSFEEPRESYFGEMSNGKDENFISAVARYGLTIQEQKSIQENSLFGADEDLSTIKKPAYPIVNPWTDLHKLELEKKSVGVYLSSNPMAPYEVITHYYCTHNFRKLNEICAQSLKKYTGQTFIIAGMVTKLKEGTTKKGNPFMRLTIEDQEDSYEFALFGEQFYRFNQFYREKLAVLLSLKVEQRPWGKPDDEPEVKIESIKLLDLCKDDLIKKVRLTIPVESVKPETIDRIHLAITENVGNSELYFYIYDETGRVAIDFKSMNSSVNPSPSLFRELKNCGLEISVN